MKWFIASLLLLGRIAHAEPARYVEVGGMIGVGKPALLNLVGTVSAGARLEAAPVWLHAQLENGPAGDDQGSGKMQQLRVGIESRTCTRTRAVCAVGGVDLGGMHGTWTRYDGDDYEDVHALIVVPRAGLEAGGEHVVATATFEIAAMLAGSDKTPYDTVPAGGLGAVELGLGLGLGYRW